MIKIPRNFGYQNLSSLINDEDHYLIDRAIGLEYNRKRFEKEKHLPQTQQPDQQIGFTPSAPIPIPTKLSSSRRMHSFEIESPNTSPLSESSPSYARMR